MLAEIPELRSDEIWLRLEQTEGPDERWGWDEAYSFSIRRAQDGCVLGMLHFRVGNSPALYYTGHIGYKVHEAHRGHHYAAKACKLAFELARRCGMDHIYINCDLGNRASSRTCELVGGVLQRVAWVPEDHAMYRGGEHKICIYRVTI